MTEVDIIVLLLQRMVMSLTSDRAVWDAVMKNEVVRELINNGEKSKINGL